MCASSVKRTVGKIGLEVIGAESHAEIKVVLCERIVYGTNRITACIPQIKKLFLRQLNDVPDERRLQRLYRFLGAWCQP